MKPKASPKFIRTVKLKMRDQYNFWIVWMLESPVKPQIHEICNRKVFKNTHSAVVTPQTQIVPQTQLQPGGIQMVSRLYSAFSKYGRLPEETMRWRVFPSSGVTLNPYSDFFIEYNIIVNTDEIILHSQQRLDARLVVMYAWRIFAQLVNALQVHDTLPVASCKNMWQILKSLDGDKSSCEEEIGQRKCYSCHETDLS